MVKDKTRYANTAGWGWGRWRGTDLKPYGTSAHFDSECVSCHLPVRDNDFVYTLPIERGASNPDQRRERRMTPIPRTLPIFGFVSLAALLCALGCDHRRTPAESDLFNPQAALPASLPVHALDGRVITSSIDRAQHTMSTLTGNDIAVDQRPCHDTTGLSRSLPYSPWPPGISATILHWFGARIPGTPKTVETVSITRTAGGQLTPAYQLFAGSPLAAVSITDPTQAAARRDAILAERSSPMRLKSGTPPTQRPVSPAAEPASFPWTLFPDP